MTEEKILMIVAPENFRDEEYFEPKEIFEQKGFDVITASKGVEVAKGKLGGETKVDIDISEVTVPDYVAVVFVGGAGSLIYENDEVISKILKEAKEDYILIGAICISPRILASNDILKGIKATVFDNDEKENSKFLEENGAVFTGEDVEEDKGIITANGPHAAKDFAKRIVKYLTLQ